MRYISGGSDKLASPDSGGERIIPWRSHEEGPGYLAHAGLEAPLANAAGGLLRLLLRRKFTVLAFCIGGAATAYGISLLQTPLFSSRALIEVRSVNHDYLSIRDVDPHSSNLPDDFYIPTQLGILQSESLIDRVRHKLLADLPAAKPGYQKALDMAAATVRARSPNQTRLVEIYVDSTDPQVAAAFAN